MTIAAAGVIFVFLISTAYGAGFHLLVGGRLAMVPVYLVCAWLGFAIGHFVGEWLGMTLLRLGIVQLLAGSVGAWSLLILGRWLFTFESAMPKTGNSVETAAPAETE